jgi:hypothetical protein
MANDNFIGDAELDGILREMGISGDEIGKAKARLATRSILPNPSDGRARGFPLLMNNLQTLTDTSAGSLTGNADRRASLRFLYLEACSVAGASLRGVTVTAITINGRNAVVGAGGIPAFAAFGSGGRPPPNWGFGVVEQGGAAIVSVLNNAGASVDVYAGFLAESID